MKEDKICDYKDLLSSLPKSLEDTFSSQIQASKSGYIDAIIVLDDDPTGTQTVYDVPVLTSWEPSIIARELDNGTPLFYILTNSRSLTEGEAEALGETIGRYIRQATESTEKKCLVISRSDSTLRGHYPAEVTALEKGLGLAQSIHLIIPAFFEGGRYTIGDIHYVKEGENLIPAAQTPFAQDKVFGYQHSNLVDWVVEKTTGAIAKENVRSISIDSIRQKSTEALTNFLNELEGGEACIVNAVDYSDLKKVAWSVLQSTQPLILRTAASFVAALDAKPPKELLTAKDLGITAQKGSLIVVGSYVPKTTIQLAHFQKTTTLYSIEIDVEKLLVKAEYDSSAMAKSIDELLLQGQSVLLYTSRKLISTDSAKKNLAIGNTVSTFLTDTVGKITVQPAFIIAKGGITSSDVATRSLAIKRAIVQGQVIPGVPVWKADEESKFPNLPYIIFPGNVGAEDAPTSAFLKLEF